MTALAGNSGLTHWPHGLVMSKSIANNTTPSTPSAETPSAENQAGEESFISLSELDADGAALLAEWQGSGGSDNDNNSGGETETDTTAGDGDELDDDESAGDRR